MVEAVHGTRLKFYRDSSLNTTTIMSHVLSSETGMPVARLMRLVDTEEGLKVLVRWKGLSNNDDTLEPVTKIYEDVPQMLLRLLQRKNMPEDVVRKARQILSL